MNDNVKDRVSQRETRPFNNMLKMNELQSNF